MLFDATQLFGDGVTAKPADQEPVDIEIRKDEEQIPFVVRLRPQPTVKANKLVTRLQKAQEIEDYETCLEALKAAAERFVKPRKKEPPVIAEFSGLTLANFEALVSDGMTYEGPLFDEMRANPRKEFAYRPELMAHLIVHSPAVRLAIITRLYELIDRALKKDEERKNDSGTSSES